MRGGVCCRWCVGVDVVVVVVVVDVIAVDDDVITDDGEGKVIASPTAVLRGATVPQYSSKAGSRAVQ